MDAELTGIATLQLAPRSPAGPWLELLALTLLAAWMLVSTAARAADEALACPAADAGAAPGNIAREVQPSALLFTRPESTVPAAKRTLRGLYVSARDAYEMVQEDPAKVLFIDVRTRAELQFIGAPALIDANVPFMLQADPPQWDEATSSLKLVINPQFVDRIAYRMTSKGLPSDAPIVLICQAGVRAARAADMLTRAGFATVYVVIDGFEGDPVADGADRGMRLVNGWRNAGLPWSTRLDRSRMDGVE